MKLIVREKGSRRWNLPVEFPLVDSEEVLVLSDRRSLPDRRKSDYELSDLRTLLSKMSAENTP
jgi:hypothetical protein